MHWIDMAVAVLFILNVVVGAIRGAIREIFSLAAIAAGLFCGYRYHPLVAVYLSNLPPAFAKGIAFVSILILVSLAVAGCGTLLGSVLKGVGAKSTDRALGGLFGAVRGVVMVALLLWGIKMGVPHGEEKIQQSTLGPIGMSGIEAATTFYENQNEPNPTEPPPAEVQ
jgi:membrane protein required for colicin V production